MRRNVFVLLALALGAALAASTQLSGGVLDVPRHWWSALAVAVPALTAAGLWAVGRRAR